MPHRLADRWWGVIAGAGAARVTAAVAGPVAARLPGGRRRFERTNHRGDPVTLLEGPVAALGAVVGVLVAPGLPPGVRLAGAVAAGGGGALGALDDAAGTCADRGLRGHLAALRRGQVTTGSIKIVGLAVTGVVAARLAGHRRVDALVSGAIVAGTANLVNLLDLRPGRALKYVLLHAATVPGTVGGARPDQGDERPATGAAGLLAAVTAGTSVAVLPEDLGERSMLGDTGANSLGAVLGLATSLHLGRAGRLAVLAALVGATAASERVSFTDLIARTPPLRVLDELGRRPPIPPA